MTKKIKADASVTAESNPPVQFEVAWQLPYVIKSIYSQLEAIANAQLAQFGIGIGVWRILAALWNHGELTNRELAHYISIEVTNLSRVSRVIQRAGLIRRKRPADNQRVVHIRLTAKGKELVERIIPHATEWQKEVLGDVSAKEMEILMPLLNRIAINLNAYSENNVDIFRSSSRGDENTSSPKPVRRAATRKSITTPR